MASSTLSLDKDWTLAATADGEVSVTVFALGTQLHWWVTDDDTPPVIAKSIAPYEFERIDMVLADGQRLWVQTASGAEVDGSVTTDG